MIEVCGITIQPHTPESLLAAGHALCAYADKIHPIRKGGD